MILALGLAFSVGFIMKLVDQLEDLPRFQDKLLWVRILGAVIYGTLMSIMVKQDQSLADLWVGLSIGLLLIGKLDCITHRLGFSVFFALVFVFDIALGNSLLFLAFLLVTVLEESFNDYIDTIKIKSTVVYAILASRPLLEIAAFITSIISGIWSIWLSLLLFDIGYQIAKNTLKEQPHAGF